MQVKHHDRFLLMIPIYSSHSILPPWFRGSLWLQHKLEVCAGTGQFQAAKLWRVHWDWSHYYYSICTSLLTISVRIHHTTIKHTSYAKLSIKSPFALARINLLFIIFVQMDNKILFKQRVQHEEWALERTCFCHEKSLFSRRANWNPCLIKTSRKAGGPLVCIFLSKSFLPFAQIAKPIKHKPCKNYLLFL